MHESLSTFVDSSKSRQQWNGTGGEAGVYRLADSIVLIEMHGEIPDDADQLFAYDFRHHVLDGASRVFFHVATLGHFSSKIRDSIFSVFREVNEHITEMHVYANPSSWPIQMGIKVGAMILKADVTTHKTNAAFIASLRQAVYGDD